MVPDWLVYFRGFGFFWGQCAGYVHVWCCGLGFEFELVIYLWVVALYVVQG